ncbi:MAG: YcxB family protein [Bacteroidetes bacterium]|nr:YcxB family protein [Bacteroidota bacterium]MBS1671918.1 YcxB family protein [Bacteroidota bacterium]
MQFSFAYNKKKVLQALRYHFISKQEIKVMIILVNVFAIASAALFYFKKIRPEPFFLGTFVWVMMMVSVWYILPYIIYNKSTTFKEKFIIHFSEHNVTLENERGYVNWEWKMFSKYFESPHFFHLYFDSKSFFLVPKDAMTEENKHDVRALLKNKIVQ